MNGGITFDVGNAPSVLAALRDPHNAQLIANAMAESYVDDIHDLIQSGRSFTPRNAGGLEQSIGWRPAGNGAAEVYANKDYAGFVEFGTGPHVIGQKPGRKGLKTPTSGQGYVLRRQVNHPGSRPHPFFFADQAARAQHMQEAGRSVLARIIANGQ
jgi:hypothetical protein